MKFEIPFLQCSLFFFNDILLILNEFTRKRGSSANENIMKSVHKVALY